MRTISNGTPCANCGKGVYWGEACSAEVLCIACADNPSRRTVAEIREWVKGRIEKKQNTLDRLAYPGYEESYMIVEYEQQEFKQLLDYIDNKEAK